MQSRCYFHGIEFALKQRSRSDWRVLLTILIKGKRKAPVYSRGQLDVYTTE